MRSNVTPKNEPGPVCSGDQEGLHGDPQPGDHEGRQQGLLVRTHLGVTLLVQG